MRPIVSFLAVFSLVTSAPSNAGIPNYPDRVPAASLLLPFFETGLDPATTPDDTLLSVANRVNATRIIHYTVWNRHGIVAFGGNVTLGPRAQWSAAMRDLIAGVSVATKNALTVGAVYRGFVTIDMVTAATALNPKQAGFPFSSANDLEGFAYYTRLTKGSANGLSMVPLEAFPHTGTVYHGYYNGYDGREAINDLARTCNMTRILDQPCVADDKISSLDNRLFGSNPLNGHTRVIVFMWNPHGAGAVEGPTDFCTKKPDDFACKKTGASYLMNIFTEPGALYETSAILLPYVVNVIELTRPFSGRVRIDNIPDYSQVPYTFAFNSAYPDSDPSLSWDAVFEGYIVP